jgi:hypothetical protein
MRRSADRILTTHVGSLIRPGELLAQAAAARTEPSAQVQYREALQRATVDVVAQQARAGVDIINDGEYGKSSWANYVLDRMTGFEFRPDTVYEATWLGRDRFRFAEFMKDQFPRGAKGAPGHACIGPITYQGHDAVRRNIADLKGALAHANVAGGIGLLDRVLGSAQLHRMHHSAAPGEAGNFGTAISLWDLVFGTYRRGTPQAVGVFAPSAYPGEFELARLLAWPLRIPARLRRRWRCCGGAALGA